MTFTLANLSLNLTSRVKNALVLTIKQIRASLQRAELQKIPTGIVTFEHVPKRQRRVTYLKSRFKHRKAIRHYIFEEYRYKINFSGTFDPSFVTLAALSSLRGDTRLACKFSWKSGNPTLPLGDVAAIPPDNNLPQV